MNLNILFDASFAIQFHVYAALLAFALGLAVLWQRKGTRSHKTWGKIWVGLMVITALTSFFIHQIRLIGPFSPIHLISIATLASLYFGVKQARAGNITEHQRSMKNIFIAAMGIAGALAFMPGRMMFEVTFAPLLTKLEAGNGNNTVESLLNGDWRVPVTVAMIVFLVMLFKQLYQRLKRSRLKPLKPHQN